MSGADEPMDTSLPPQDGAVDKEEEPMETEETSKPHPSASTPVSQNPPGLVLERTLSVPSQPEFSHVGSDFLHLPVVHESGCAEPARFVLAKHFLNQHEIWVPECLTASDSSLIRSLRNCLLHIIC